MKGIVNRGIQDLVETKFGPEAWDKVKSLAGCQEPFFAITDDYPDEETLALVKAAAEVSGLGMDAVLVEFGRFFVPNTLKAHYPAYFKLAGSSAREFLLNMDQMHQHVTRCIANAKPPRFAYDERPDGRLLIKYTSRRRLCALLRGLIQGVGRLFDQALTVRERTCMHRGDPHCTMEVTFS